MSRHIGRIKTNSLLLKAYVIGIMLVLLSCKTNTNYYEIGSFKFPLSSNIDFIKTEDMRFGDILPDYVRDIAVLSNEENQIYISLLEFETENADSSLYHISLNEAVVYIKQELILQQFSDIREISSSDELVRIYAEQINTDKTDNSSTYVKYSGVYYDDGRIQLIQVMLPHSEKEANEKWINQLLKNYRIN